jgi:alkanesulfonate monooxygenase SsuD/methylene tetrahydromethanopterin reductase-like flavin-dependent oxidoreductase (luciferase family)
MPDFGHDLQFSTFPEPTLDGGKDPVGLAIDSERWGYDLVSFQDHPYVPGYLDVWPLMSWVAARTERIRVAPNVLNTAMRSPAIVAKQAASLDLLSGGRVELGLGAGYFWDAMVSMGVERRTPGQSVEAFGEALEVIRALWARLSTSPDEPVYRAGIYHHLDGVRPGPAPAHEIPVWVGATQPRMLRLVGRKADVWTATLGAGLTRRQWQQASTVIDESAAAAGREPSAIRRFAAVTGTFVSRGTDYLHGPPDQWVEQLLPSVLEDGVSGFLLATDDRPTLERFAAEVIPALRSAVETERGQWTRTAPR